MSNNAFLVRVGYPTGESVYGFSDLDTAASFHNTKQTEGYPAEVYPAGARVGRGWDTSKRLLPF